MDEFLRLRISECVARCSGNSAESFELTVISVGGVAGSVSAEAESEGNHAGQVLQSVLRVGDDADDSNCQMVVGERGKKR